jgi:hypothetical protein
MPRGTPPSKVHVWRILACALSFGAMERVNVHEDDYIAAISLVACPLSWLAPWALCIGHHSKVAAVITTLFDARSQGPV